MKVLKTLSILTFVSIYSLGAEDIEFNFGATINNDCGDKKNLKIKN